MQHETNMASFNRQAKITKYVIETNTRTGR